MTLLFCVVLFFSSTYVLHGASECFSDSQSPGDSFQRGAFRRLHIWASRSTVLSLPSRHDQRATHDVCLLTILFVCNFSTVPFFDSCLVSLSHLVAFFSYVFQSLPEKRDCLWCSVELFGLYFSCAAHSASLFYYFSPHAALKAAFMQREAFQ